MDAHGLLCELEDEIIKFTNKDYTHIGIGFAWNKENVRVVEIFSAKPLTIN